MVSQMAKDTVAKWEKEGLRPSFDDIVPIQVLDRELKVRDDVFQHGVQGGRDGLVVGILRHIGNRGAGIAGNGSGHEALQDHEVQQGAQAVGLAHDHVLLGQCQTCQHLPDRRSGSGLRACADHFPGHAFLCGHVGPVAGDAVVVICHDVNMKNIEKFFT